jgi:hypothetical protein
VKQKGEEKEPFHPDDVDHHATDNNRQRETPESSGGNCAQFTCC